MSVVNCPNCHTPAPPGAIFCDSCGFDLRTIASSAPAVAPTFHVPETGGGKKCPACGYENEAGSLFCESCGARLPEMQPLMPAAEPPPSPAPPPYIPPQPVYTPPPISQPEPQAPPQPAPVLREIPGRLVLQSQNVTIPIPPGKETVIIGREDPVSGIFPEVDLEPYGAQADGVGRKHAQLLIHAGKVCIEDLDSVNGTAVNKQKIPSRQPQPIQNGDEIRLGRMILIYRTD